MEEREIAITEEEGKYMLDGLTYLRDNILIISGHLPVEMEGTNKVMMEEMEKIGSILYMVGGKIERAFKNKEVVK